MTNTPPPGPALDDLIGPLMGWRKVSVGWLCKRGRRRCPSTDISAAMLVVKEMKKRGWLFHILEMVDGWVVNGMHYAVKDGDWAKSMRTGCLVQVPADTAPEGICRAALEAEIERPST